MRKEQSQRSQTLRGDQIRKQLQNANGFDNKKVTSARIPI